MIWVEAKWLAIKITLALAIIGAAAGWYWKVCQLVYRVFPSQRSR